MHSRHANFPLMLTRSTAAPAQWSHSQATSSRSSIVAGTVLPSFLSAVKSRSGRAAKLRRIPMGYWLLLKQPFLRGCGRLNFSALFQVFPRNGLDLRDEQIRLLVAGSAESAACRLPMAPWDPTLGRTDNDRSFTPHRLSPDQHQREAQQPLQVQRRENRKEQPPCFDGILRRSRRY